MRRQRDEVVDDLERVVEVILVPLAPNLLDALKGGQLRQDMLIFTFSTSKSANIIRETYYQACQIGTIRHIEDAKGVLFTSSEGLFSYAYHEHILRTWLTRANFQLRVVPFASDLGKIFYACTGNQASD